MARTLKDTSLDTRAARTRLKARGKPYYRVIEEGLHLGYRKPRGRRGKPAVSGKWVLRRYVGGQAYIVETIGIADDFDDADGHAILNFSQAQDKARERFKQGARDTAGITGPYTVANAMVDYFQRLRHQSKETYARDAEYRSNAFIIPKLGTIECKNLTTRMIYDFMNGVASTAPRLRTRKGEKPKPRELDTTDKEAVRCRKASANRLLTILRGALNHAFHENRVSSDAEWRKVKPYTKVNTARIRFLTIDEAKRLVNSTDEWFRPMVAAALAMGARYGELCALDVQDWDPDSATLSIRHPKSGRSRKTYLNREGERLFERLAAGRVGNEPLLRDRDGQRFAKSQQARPMREACARAKIKPAISFHALRHTYASLLVKSGVHMRIVAEALGHSSTAMTEKFYAHLAPSHVADVIREKAPVFGLGKSNVIGMR